MSSRIHEANDYGHNLNLLVILHELQVSYPTRRGSREKSIQITHVYLRPVTSPNFSISFTDLEHKQACEPRIHHHLHGVRAILVVENGRTGLPIHSCKVSFKEVAPCTPPTATGLIRNNEQVVDFAHKELNGFPSGCRLGQPKDFGCESCMLVAWHCVILNSLS